MTVPPVEQTDLASTGVPGLDDVLAGGLPTRRLHLLQGSPGAGKTTVALQFLREGVRLGERSLYVSMSESQEEMESVAAAHGWSLGGIDIFEAAEDATTEAENTLFHPSEVELGERMHRILAEVARVKPHRLVLDSCTELRLLAGSAVRYRRQILALKRELVEAGRTVLLVDNPAPDEPDVLLQSLAHGVVTLEQLHPAFGAERRRLRVLKMRGVAYRGGYHDFTIRRGGLAVFPRLVASEHRSAVSNEHVSTGVVELDGLVGGGLNRGTSTLIIGPAGAGKSLLATLHVLRAAERGERAVVFSFDESREIALARSRALGMDLAPHIASGAVVVEQVDPAELSPGEFVYRVRAAVDEGGARVIVLDSLNGLMQAMPNETFVTLQLHELLSFLSHRGVLTLVLLAQHGLVGDQLETPVDVSYLADTVLLLRYFEAEGGVRKALSVVKKRTGAHETTIRELYVDGQGVHVGAPLTAFRGVLSGVPVYDPAAGGPQLGTTRKA
jgi:circadian clock protein KaiC